MIRSVEYCFRNKIIASFYYDDCNTQRHLVGYIERFNDSEILIAHISSRGCYDGFILKHIEDIYRIDYGGEYEKKIEKLYKIRGQMHATINTFGSDDEIFYSLMDFVEQNSFLVTLEFAESCITGLVNGYSDDIVYLTIINDYGEEDGISIVHIDEIQTVSVDSDNEQDLRTLYAGHGDKDQSLTGE